MSEVCTMRQDTTRFKASASSRQAGCSIVSGVGALALATSTKEQPMHNINITTRARRAALALLGAVAVTTSVAAPSAAAAARPAIDLQGSGTYADQADGSVTVRGTIASRPFSGQFTAVLAADDGSLPEPGVCEPATASIRVSGPHRQFLKATGTGTVCGEWVQPPYIVTESFTGRYTVKDASNCRLRRTDGFIEIRLANDGSASAALFDS
jgi:hypothetical protein